VARISEKLELSDESLKLLSDARLIPGCAATVVERGVDGVVVETAAGRYTIPREVADQVSVTTGRDRDAPDPSLAASR
jgi:sugar/nucleoside kinase (ribokinase family)